MRQKSKKKAFKKLSLMILLGYFLELHSATGDMIRLDDALREPETLIKPELMRDSEPLQKHESSRVLEPLRKPNFLRDTVPSPKRDTLSNSIVIPESVQFNAHDIQEFNSPILSAQAVMVYDEQEHRQLYSKNSKNIVPIASITKLMTAMVVLDAHLPMEEKIKIGNQDKMAVNKIRQSHSRLFPGITLTRGELIKLALMSSDNRAAIALARTYPGGMSAAVEQMNIKARKLHMDNTRFLEPTGLNSGNVSTAQDLVKMVLAAQEYDSIHQATTTVSHQLSKSGQRQLQFHNTNPLVKNANWNIYISKTGFINRAGRCLVMKAYIHNRPVVIVLLDSKNVTTRTQDAINIMDWIERV